MQTVRSESKRGWTLVNELLMLLTEANHYQSVLPAGSVGC